MRLEHESPREAHTDAHGHAQGKQSRDCAQTSEETRASPIARAQRDTLHQPHASTHVDTSGLRVIHYNQNKHHHKKKQEETP